METKNDSSFCILLQNWYLGTCVMWLDMFVNKTHVDRQRSFSFFAPLLKNKVHMQMLLSLYLELFLTNPFVLVFEGLFIVFHIQYTVHVVWQDMNSESLTWTKLTVPLIHLKNDFIV